VAAEVRSLAQRSAAAAKEISALIGDSVQRIEHGGALVTEAGKRMDEILGSTRQVARIMFEITLATQEQSSKIEQVSAAIAQMDQFTQQNATLVEHASAAAESLRRQVERLDRALGFFRVSEAALAEHAAPAPLRVQAAAPVLGYRG
jgi:methyl-accepting chemotaxis protein